MPRLPEIEVFVNKNERYIEARVRMPRTLAMTDNAIEPADWSYCAIGPAGWSVVIHYDTGERLASRLLPPTVEDLKQADLGYLLPPILVAETTTTLGVEVPLSKLPEIEAFLLAAAKEEYQNKST